MDDGNHRGPVLPHHRHALRKHKGRAFILLHLLQAAGLLCPPSLMLTASCVLWLPQ